MTLARPLRSDDLPAAAALHAACFPDEPWDAAQLRQLLAMPGTRAWLAERGAAAAGLLLLRRAADEAEVLTLAVAPGERRRGLGGALLRQGLAAALAEGARRCFLEVAADNTAAQALYARLGFRPVGRRRDYYRQGADAVVLRLDLPDSRQL